MMNAIIPKMIGAITIKATPNTSSPVTPFETPMLAEKIPNMITYTSPTTIPKIALIFTYDMTSILLTSCINAPTVTFQQQK
jgi:hypothetical protein